MTAQATVVMPWRATPDRIGAHQYCTRYWRSHGYPIVHGDSTPTKPFNRAQARNNAANKAATDTIIVADADVIPADINQIHQAVHLAQQGAAVTPYSTYQLLPADAVTATDLAAVEPVREYAVKWRPAGITVITRTAWTEVGGYDENFGAGWCCEDTAFWYACETLIGIHQLPGILYAFDHHGHRIRNPKNRRRLWWYERARGNPEEMQRLTNATRLKR